MINREILSDATDKAIANGYKPDARNYRNSVEIQLLNIYATIFTHDFAKAFWGSYYLTEDKNNNQIDVRDYEVAYAWQYHLQQLVLYEDPLAYLKKFLD